ncbi:MAG: ribulose-5-phosphate 4-epimerase/fuculose-1-phosphate aldolase [Candidatus Azotimanducaceae bacterium]|jgi:ribulose-5-phosphate 4-epimerase/fuculose-1-phosphate aldolase
MSSEISATEWAVRVNLAALYRLVALEGWDDMLDTHISGRVPGPDQHFLINPYGMMFEEITASSLIRVDADGNKLTASDYEVNQAGFTIHSAVHMARHDANFVVHLHTPNGIAVSCQEDGLLPINQTALSVYGELTYHDYEGIALDLDERQRLIRDLGNSNAMLLRNHGTLACGPNAGGVWQKIYRLETACDIQIRAQSSGRGLSPIAQNILEQRRAGSTTDSLRRRGEFVWPAMIRRLDRIDSGYRD